MGNALGPLSRQALDRLCAIDFLRPEVDRRLAESGVAGYFQALELPPRPLRWLQDVESGLREYLQATWTRYLRSPEPRVDMKHTMGHPSPFLEEIHGLARFEVTDPKYFPALSKALAPPIRRGSRNARQEAGNPVSEEAWRSVQEAFESAILSALREASSKAAEAAARAVLNSLGPREGETGHEPAFWVLVHTGGSHGCYPIEDVQSFVHRLAEAEAEGRFDEHDHRASTVIDSLLAALEAGLWICLPLRNETLVIPRPPLTPSDLRKGELRR